MKTNFSELKLRQLDTALTRWREASLPPRPASGWVKAIREALGMSAVELARRLGVSVPTATRMELSEAEDRITLSTLRRAAEALGCELQYALVPQKSLVETLETRALTLARQQMAAVNHTMALEAQATSPEMIEAQTRALAENLLKSSRRKLWKAS